MRTGTPLRAAAALKEFRRGAAALLSLLLAATPSAAAIGKAAPARPAPLPGLSPRVGAPVAGPVLAPGLLSLPLSPLPVLPSPLASRVTAAGAAASPASSLAALPLAAAARPALLAVPRTMLGAVPLATAPPAPEAAPAPGPGRGADDAPGGPWEAVFDGSSGGEKAALPVPGAAGLVPVERALRAYLGRKDPMLRAPFFQDNVGGDRSRAKAFVYGEDHSDKELVRRNMARLSEDIVPGRKAILLVEGYPSGAAMDLIGKFTYLKKRGVDTQALTAKGVSLKDDVELRGWDDPAELAKGETLLRQYVSNLSVLKRLAELESGRPQRYAVLLRHALKTFRQWLATRAVVITRRNASLDRALAATLAEAGREGASVHVIAGSQHLFARPLLSGFPLAGGMRLRPRLRRALSSTAFAVDKPAYSGEPLAWGEKIEAMQRRFLGWDSMERAGSDARRGPEALTPALAADAAALRRAYAERGADLADDSVEAFRAGDRAEEAVFDAARAEARALLASAGEDTRRRLAAVLDLEFTSIIANRNAARAFASLAQRDPTRSREDYEAFARVLADSRWFDGLASRAHEARNPTVLALREQDPVFKGFSERLSEIIKSMSMDGSGDGPKRENWVRKNAFFSVALSAAAPHLLGHPLRFVEPRSAAGSAPSALKSNLAAALGAVHEVQSLHLRSNSAIERALARLPADSPRRAGLQRQRDEALAGVLAVRAEFALEFGLDKAPDAGRLARRMREITARHRAGNCDEQAFLVQASLRARGLRADLVAFETVDWWARGRRLAEANHVFVVVGLAPGANPAIPSTWGPDAVIADAWSGLAGPAAPTLEKIYDKVFRLERSHQIPSLRTVNYEDLYGWSRNWHA